MNSTSTFKAFILILLVFAIGNPTAYCQLPTTNFQLPITNYQFRQGAIHIKVKKEIRIETETGKTTQFGVSTLDKLARDFDIRNIQKRFKHKLIAKNSGLPDLSRIYVVEFSNDLNEAEIAAAFANDPNIEYAEAIPIYRTAFEPDDPLYSQQQHLPQIMAAQAWDVHKGEDGEEVVVAIIDTGVDWKHSDLTENCWQNLGEDADGDGVTLEYIDGEWVRDPGDFNGIDDDGNGFTDDLIGWDFHEQATSGDGSNPDPLWGQGPYEHGTHCAGISSGVTNNENGIASVSHNVKYMATQVDNGNDNFQYAWDAIIYAAENGADIISNSWGGPNYSEVGRETIEYAVGLGSIVVVAAHNYNTDQKYYPAAYPGSIGVSALDPDDTRASFTNYGAWLDIAAPGVTILSTVTNEGYSAWNGTSMATPMVAGLFALVKSYQPDWTNDQLIHQVLGSADDIDDINSGYERALGSGRINAYEALVSETATAPQELRLEFIGHSFSDDNGNGALEAGELVTISFSMHNFAHLVGDPNASFHLTTFDEDITLIESVVTGGIPADGSFEIEDGFIFKIADDAKPHIADFIIEVHSDLPVYFDNEIEITAMVSPSGFLVWEGEANGNDYSGAYIYEYLQARGHSAFHMDQYLSSFNGFDAAFLSFGNIGQTGEYGTFLSYEHTLTIQDYLENGNNLYSEGSPFMVIPTFGGFPNATEFTDLYGVDQAATSFETPNPISRLSGVESSLMHEMEFNSSGQQQNWYIDQIFEQDGADIPFVEEGWGNVGIYNEGSYGQKTFHFAYALAELEDKTPHSSRYHVLKQVMDFFGYPENYGYIVTNFSADMVEGTPGMEVQFSNWTFADEGVNITGWAWDFNGDGIYDSYDENPSWIYYKGGIYDVQLIAYSDEHSDTLTRKQYISVRDGVLVYEGAPDENGYSGTFIRDYLEDNNYPTVGYTNKFPQSLNGYDAVFLSFGNTGLRGTDLTSSIASTVNSFLTSGGKVYIEGGDALLNMENQWTMFGLADVEEGSTNYIEELMGNDQAITHGMMFNNSNQLSNRKIDRYTIYDDIPEIQVAFDESEYGPVAVQFDGNEMFGQKTFCMSYAISELENTERENTREELLQRILDFFDVVSDVDELGVDLPFSATAFPNPTQNEINLGLQVDEESRLEITLHDLTGKQLLQQEREFSKGTHRLSFSAAGYPAGVYYFNLKGGKGSRVVKWVRID